MTHFSFIATAYALSFLGLFSLTLYSFLRFKSLSRDLKALDDA